MKKLFRNNYFFFLLIYLCILSIVGLSLSFSKFTSGDTEIEDAHAAIYNVEIYSGELGTKEKNISVSVYATGKISELASLISGTYEKKQINIFNLSECDIVLSDMKLDEHNDSIFEKLIIPMSEKEMTEFENECGGIPQTILKYIGKSSSELANADDVRKAVSEKNAASLKSLEKDTLKPGDSRTLFIISWVEHDDVYKADADNNADKISHKSLQELGKGKEEFKFELLSKQVD